jgi:hypothetical protein
MSWFSLSSGSIVRRIGLIAVCLLAMWGGTSPGRAEPASAEPTREQCEAEVAQARAQAAVLPADDLSRYFAERDLTQALVEAGNGEFDDCLDATARATEELRQRRHALPPGERLKILQSNEMPMRDGKVAPVQEHVDRAR